MLAVLLAGIPVSLIVTPVLFLVVLTLAHLIDLVATVPQAFWDALAAAGRLLPEALEPLDRGLNRGDWATLDIPALIRLGLLLIAPGMAFMLILWIWTRALFWHAGTGGVLLSLGARDPRRDDLEERQIGNLLEEISIAAGIAPPALAILDQEEPNAAVVGSGPGDATVVVTRGLLDQLDRDQTQAVLGHQIGAICNGDLRIAMLLLSVNQTFGLLATILAAGSARKARRALWGSIRGLFIRDDRATHQIAALLAADHEIDPAGKEGCLMLLRAPFVMAAATTSFLIMIGQTLLFGPLLGALWRARRFLADATAVKLTRNPDGMTHALQILSRSTVRFEKGDPAALMFVHWPSVSGSGAPPQPLGSWHPSMARRLHRLEALGGRMMRTGQPGAVRAGPGIVARVISGILMLLVYALLAAGTVVMLAGGVLLMTLTLVIVGFALFLIHHFFKNLPDIIHWFRYEAVPLLESLVAAVRSLIAEIK